MGTKVDVMKLTIGEIKAFEKMARTPFMQFVSSFGEGQASAEGMAALVVIFKRRLGTPTYALADADEMTYGESMEFITSHMETGDEDPE